MDKFKGKYRIPSARWATWDYGGNAALERQTPQGRDARFCVSTVSTVSTVTVMGTVTTTITQQDNRNG